MKTTRHSIEHGTLVFLRDLLALGAGFVVSGVLLAIEITGIAKPVNDIVLEALFGGTAGLMAAVVFIVLLHMRLPEVHNIHIRPTHLLHRAH